MLGSPKIAIGVALMIALIIGAISFVIHNNMDAERSAKITSIPSVAVAGNKSASPQDLTLAFPVGGRIKNVSAKVGDIVKAGTVLADLDAKNAIGAVSQAKAAYQAAQINYEKLVNGSSAPDIEVARVALNNAKNTYNAAVAQQKVLVANALSAMLNSELVAMPAASTAVSPVISGTYAGAEEGSYVINVYATGNGGYFSFSGLESGNSQVSATPIPLGTRGLYIQFPANFISNSNNTWKISIPNDQSPSYLTYLNAYKLALQNQAQSVAVAQAVLDSAQAVLDQKVAGARSEDLAIARAQVESTKGALQIAEGAYDNTIITAPMDGKITKVVITAGQIVAPNTPAIEISSQ